MQCGTGPSHFGSVLFHVVKQLFASHINDGGIIAMHGYKVVRIVITEKKDIAFESCYASGTGAVRYDFEVVTKPNPNCGPLAVFCDIETANKFAYSTKDIGLCVLHCQYIPSEETRLRIDSYITEKEYLPRGTCFADAVMLIEQTR